MTLSLTGSVSMLLCLSVGLASGVAAPKPAELEWLKQNVVPLRSCEAGQGFEDLAPLKRMVGDARIVALGECTHGTREVFQMKHRILEYLASQCGFTIFSIEANMPEAYRLNDYVLKGKGDPAKLIGGMYFWTWDTEEVLAMVQWMRQFNQSGKGRLEFTGFDMQTPDVAMENVTRFLQTNDPARVKGIQTTYHQVLQARQRRGGGGAGFGVATGKFPVEAAKGKKIRYSGWIKTAGVTRGFAGLWWRADGDSGVLAFDNMQSRQINGDTEWKQYEIVLDIPAETININFGVILPGDGKAWFDDLKVETDGKEFDAAGRFDFGFESGAAKGFFTGGAGYRAVVDDEVAHTGKRSLRLEFIGDGGSSGDAAGMEPATAAKACGEILTELESQRDRYVKASSARETDWALQNARVVYQCAQMDAQEAQRDPCMARNVQWILDHSPKDAKIVLWAHNGHVCRMKEFMGKSMGACLSDVYGKGQVVIGFAAGSGQYTAVVQGKGLRSDNRLQEPSEGGYEAYFRASGVPNFMLDLRRAAKDDPGSGWLAGSLPFRSIGAVAMEEQFGPANLSELFDVICYFDQTTASRLLPGARGSPRKK
jgi:erythromycin esterase-like protein